MRTFESCRGRTTDEHGAPPPVRRVTRPAAEQAEVAETITALEQVRAFVDGRTDAHADTIAGQ